MHCNALSLMHWARCKESKVGLLAEDGPIFDSSPEHPQPQDHFSLKEFTVFLVGTIISYGKLSLVFWSLKKNDRALFEKMAFLDFAS